MTVFGSLAGQDDVVGHLRAAVEAASASPPGAAMTHAWLFTGPPGSGRSVAARAFAAALQCPERGCGRCHDCRTVLAGTHPYVDVVRPEGLSIGVREARELVLRAALSTVGTRWQVVLVEDADRLTEGAANVLLKALEEPTPRSVWLLCVPAADELPLTIRSRCRLVRLRIPSTDAVARLLVERDGIDPAMAGFAARAAQGHVGRARRLATDEEARRRRREVLAVPTQLANVGACVVAAENLVDATREEAAAVTAPMDAAETAEFREALGGTSSSSRGVPRGAVGALRELEARQKSRGTRTQRDALDRGLSDLAAFYRDVLMMQLGAQVELICADIADAVARVARSGPPEATLRRLVAVLEAGDAIDLNVAPQLALEAMTVRLGAG